MAIVGEILAMIAVLVAFIPILVLFYQILEVDDMIKKYKEDKRHSKLIGKGYYRLIRGIKYKYRYSHYRKLNEIIEEYLGEPEEYYVYMLKYEYTFTLINTMLDEAKESDVKYEEEFVNELNSLVEEMSGDFEEVRKRLQDKKDRLKRDNVTVINKQLREERTMLRDIRKMREGK